MPTGKTEEWAQAGHSLHIKSWYPRSEWSIIPAWYQGFIDGVLETGGTDFERVKTIIEETAKRKSTEDGEFGQEEF